jgi:hypothetical protein
MTDELSDQRAQRLAYQAAAIEPPGKPLARAS